MTASGYSAEQVRAAEAPLLAAGVPLMATAAEALAHEVFALNPATVLLLVGSGDNGGDALYAGAWLARAGVDVDILCTGSRVHRPALVSALDAGGRLVDDVPALVDVVVDGILGIGAGAGSALRGEARTAVEAVLALPVRPHVVAVDIPSGVNPDDGSVADAVVLPADLTVTFGAMKAGLLRGPGARLAGRVHLVDIGLDFSGVEPILRQAGPDAAQRGDD